MMDNLYDLSVQYMNLEKLYNSETNIKAKASHLKGLSSLQKRAKSLLEVLNEPNH